MDTLKTFRNLLLVGLLCGSGFIQTARGDLNGDGKADIVWRNQDSGENYVWFMNGTNLPNGSSINTVHDQHWQIVGLGDFNHDGKADLFWRNSATGETWVYLMNGSSISAQGPLPTVSDLHWVPVGVGDLNGDGRADVVWRHQTTGENFVWFMNGTSLSGLSSINYVPNQNWRITGVGDFNHDGKADLFWRNSATGETWVYLMNGSSISAQGPLPTVSDLNWQPIENVTEQTSFTVSTNSSDPLLVKAITSNATRIDYYGERDSNGIPIAVTQGQVIDNNGDVRRYQFDSNGRLTKMTAPDGTEISWNWVSPTTIAVTVTTGDGTAQVNTTVDTTKTPSAIAHPAQQAQSLSTQGNSLIKNTAPRGNQEIKLQYAPSREKPIGQFQNITGSSDVMIHVTQCGIPTSLAEVSCIVRDTDYPDYTFLRSIPAYPISDGLFSASIPTNLAPKLKVQDICESTAEVLGYTCDLFIEQPGLPLYVCSQITIAVAATGIGAVGLAETIGAVCAATTAGLELYCETLNASPGPGAPSLADQLCDALPEDITLRDTILLQARVNAIPYNITGPHIEVNSEGPFPPLTIDLGSDTVIRSLALDPPSPAAWQSYEATADIYCVPAQTRVVLSVVGTDGYANSVNYTQSTPESNGTFTLFVPGGAGGIVDVITLTVTTPDGKIFTRTASLTFI